MPQKINRRDFLQLTSALSLLTLVKSLPLGAQSVLMQERPPANVIIIVFDALSALHLSLYGYPRRTSSNLERLAQRATVYHAHRSAANFTTPSTASLFTGAYPWTHRVFSLSGLLNPRVRQANLFQLLQDTYYQAAFVQNMYADLMVYQCMEHLDRHLGPDSMSLVGSTIYDHLFPNDAVYGAKSYDQFLFNPKEKPGSLFLSIPVDLVRQYGKRNVADRLASEYPEGLPFLVGPETYFSIEQIMGEAQELLSSLPAPYFAYLHFMPPHAPYRPNRHFLNTFKDGWSPEPKKGHPLSGRRSQEFLNSLRQEYDEYIANLDWEFGKLLDHLEQIGALDHSYLIVTSDHGDFFERGEQGHVTPLLFEEVIRIPLIISAPGQTQRRDIHIPTSNVDLLPTLLKLVGAPIPETCEGKVLPGMGGEERTDRSIFVVEAKKSRSYRPLNKISTALIKGDYKLIYYLGYKHYSDEYEFYDLKHDPEERNNQFPSHPAAKELQAELEKKLEQVNQPFRKRA